MNNEKETKDVDLTIDSLGTLKTQEDLYKVPEVPEIDSNERKPGSIVINGKKRYFLLSGKLGFWNDVVAEKKRIAKRRAKNKVARVSRKLNVKLRKQRKRGK